VSPPLRSYLQGDTLPERALNFLSAFREVRFLAFAVTLTNIGGVGYGLYYYWGQFGRTAWYLLPFVPDSPTGPFLMVIIFLLWWGRNRARSATLELIAFVSLVKYGIWTLVIFKLYWDDFFTGPNAQLSWALLFLHGAEALQAGILLKGMRLPSLQGLTLGAAWFALGDFSDYVLGTHPELPVGLDPSVGQRVVPVMTVALTIICYVAAVLWCRRAARSGGAPQGGAENAKRPPHPEPPP
jgi:uncharacterized membrane protein YpjA